MDPKIQNQNPQALTVQDDFVVPVRQADGSITMADFGSRTSKGAVSPSPTQKDRLARILASAAVLQLSPIQTARLRNAGESYLSEVRTVEQTREQLERPDADGGAGIASPDAAWLVDVMQAVRFQRPVPARHHGKLAVSPAVPPQQPATPPVQSPTKVASAVVATPPRASAPTVSKAEVVAEPRLERDEFLGLGREQMFVVLAKELIADVQPQVTTPAMSARLEALVVTRLRDVRDQAELRQQLLKTSTDGGVGMPPAEAERVAGRIESYYAKLQQQLLKTKKEHIVSELKREERKTTVRREEGSAMAEYANQVWIENRIAKADTSATMGHSQAVRPTPPPNPAPDTGITPRAVMQDVVPAPARLLGPIEELASMTLADFRRLAKHPSDAVARILEKMRLLEEEDYRQRVLAVSAWHSSEPARLYFDMTRRALEEGISVAKQLGVESATSLTAEEYNAIMKLHETLRA